MSKGSYNIHRLAGTLARLRHEAATGQCALHPDRPAVGFIEGWDLYPKGCCEACADYGHQHGYTIHTVCICEGHEGDPWINPNCKAHD